MCHYEEDLPRRHPEKVFKLIDIANMDGLKDRDALLLSGVATTA